ncbi:hypothetical protein [uncultured Gimesia sp.]|uniref:hypothetical protein n=1 Tax=uncultured Gimesia sp. TaxID=1678688 RepID=UPI0030DBA0CB|tara:strand:+ start:92993 stop:93226 length:234 start_codon:yes stop_codon:yes gene_type:complete
MKSELKQVDNNSKIDSLAEQIFIRMCVTSHHGFDATHYVKKSYELAKVFHQHMDVLKKASNSKSNSVTKNVPGNQPL